MSLSTKDRVVLWAKAAARCSFPDCRKPLVYEHSAAGDGVLLGEAAHIVAQKADGPRGRERPPGDEIDGYENTILLCKAHHTIIDREVRSYPVAKLLQLKKDHEDWVASSLSPREQYAGLTQPADFVSETVYSTHLPVLHIPRFVHLAPYDGTERDVNHLIQGSNDRNIMTPFIVRGGNLLTFCDLDDETGPFRSVVDPYGSEKCRAEDWWNDPDHLRWYMELLNRALNKLTGRMGLNLDKDHKRYYFEPSADGTERQITYTSMGTRQTSRYVAWQPTFRRSGEKKNYWEHLAVGLRFHRMAEASWSLSIRPERRFTRDGYTPLTPKGTGRRSTSKKSHMYNFDVLSEVHFWRDYFSNGTPRILFKFGKQSIVVSSEILSDEIFWPPITDDMKRRMNILYEDDLFSLADYNEAVEFEDQEAFGLIDDDLTDDSNET